MASHRSTIKKAKKPFKARHGTKSQLKARNKGKIEKNVGKNKPLKQTSRLERKNLADQLREQKIAASVQQRKLFSSKISKIVTVVSLTDDIDPKSVVSTLINEPCSSITNFKSSNYKSRFKFVVPENDVLSVLDAARVSDFVLLLLSAEQEVTDGEDIIRAIESQGVSNVGCIVPNLDTGLREKQQKQILASLTSYFTHFFPVPDKVYNLHSDTGKLLHWLSSTVPKGVNWLNHRGYLVAESVEIGANSVLIDGIVRGAGFYVSQIVNIPNVGRMTIDKIERIGHNGPEEVVSEVSEVNLDEVEVDDVMEMEDYDDDEDIEPYSDEDIDAEDEEFDPEIEAILAGKNQVDISNNNNDIEFNENYNNNSQLQQFQEDSKNIDEFYLDPHQSAKERLAEYKFATTEIDTTPLKTDVIIKSYKNSSSRVLKNYSKNASAVLGDSVRLHLVEFDITNSSGAESVFNSYQNIPLTVFGLAAHEQKSGLCNFSFKPWEDYNEPIPSHESLIVQYGSFRRIISPLFSRDTRNSQNIHRFIKFANSENSCIASAVCPAVFGSCPAIFFKNTSNGIKFVGSGTLESVDSARTVVKRRLLVGQPFKIHKKVITIRYMFFNPQDVDHFKSVPLFTDSGSSGFIKESLGTHGYLKASFNKKLSAQDHVYMALYKKLEPSGSSEYTQ